MDAKRAAPPGTNAIVRPFAVMAARFLGPGRLRLQMIRLSHGLDAIDAGGSSGHDGQAIQPDQRAA
jgi:hypothetical protein